MSDQNDDKDQNAIIEELRRSVAKLEEKNRELLTEKRRQGEGKIDAAELERVERERDEANAKLADANKQLKAVNATAEKVAKELAAEQANTAKLLINDGLMTALTAAGVTDAKLIKAAAAMIRDEYKPGITVDGESRVAMIGDKPLAQFVKDWALGDDGKSFVAAPHNAGGGATGGKGGTGQVNPFDPATKNVTEQGKLFLQNPTLARQMAAEHGVTLE